MTPPPDDSTASAFRWCPVQQMGCHQCPAGCDIAAPAPTPAPSPSQPEPGTLDELRSLSDQAPSGRWWVSGEMVLHSPYGEGGMPISFARMLDRPTAAFVAAAANHVRALLAAPPPVPGDRPDTSRMRAAAKWLAQWVSGPTHRSDNGWGAAVAEGADWIDAQPAHPAPDGEAGS